jgi:putative spermidine/putrescine transport system permease protein
VPDHRARLTVTAPAAAPRPAARRRTRRRLGRSLLLAPGLAVLVPFFLAPLAVMLTYSFYRFIPGGQQAPAFSGENYGRFLFDGFYQAILGDTLLLGLAVTVLSLVLSYPLAYTIARSRSRWTSWLIVIVLVPLMTSVVVRSYGWMILLANNGVVNAALAALGLSPLPLMFNFTGTIIALTEVLMPFMVLSLVGVLQSIDPALEEAARSLGAGRARVFRDVILPLSLPGVAAGSLLVFALSIGAFATPQLVGGARTKVIATVVYNQAINVLNWPFAAAISFILMVIVIGLTVLQGRALGGLRKGLS